ncbi:cation diffusion facilitator family transporter [Pseudidiomarina mangrovi]|uniref:cation diffusion facilitator family transporter n=1 Tax=Pseudidiomarina mangrovi TaxID=2487133 RepID=UPI000FCA2FD9|nr:cation diffusion facilitator family transporter [Pseudidiomarina mangrovi]
MAHHHHHHHHHDHSESSSQRIGWAFFLNLGFTIIEFIGGILTNSTAILADAVHDLGDSIAIGSAWVLNKLSGRDPSQRYTYGYQRLSLVGALINAVILIAGSVWILMLAIPRLWQPQMPHAEGMLALAVLGIAINGYAAYKLSRGKTMNERVLNWHLLEDVLGWVAVLLVSIVLMFVDWPILDPLLSIAFTLFILLNVVKSLSETIKLFVQAAPDESLTAAIHKALSELTEVADVHHLHVWSLDGERHVCTAHLALHGDYSTSELRRLKTQVAERLEPFHLAHTTIEFEFPLEQCRDEHSHP